jgi:hypothetical protein
MYYLKVKQQKSAFEQKSQSKIAKKSILKRKGRSEITKKYFEAK